uniref:Uncharacterized protein n=1 Tax=Rhizophora mucronata TaxID=61149 RepID=A0A2P2NXD8_RHIMU
MTDDSTRASPRRMTPGSVVLKELNRKSRARQR